MAFAPGKVILLGEHSVVYGHPALAGALSGGVEVLAVPADGAALHLRVPAWGVAVRPGEGDSPLAHAWKAIRDEVARLPGYRDPEVDLVARFELPTGSGLGSSASMSVAAARALAEAAGVALDLDRLCAAAMAAETVFHGRPSGIDHAVAAHGGFGLFTRATGLSPLPPSARVPLVIGHTGRARDTKGRVARVAELHTERPAETNARFEAIAQLVRRAAAAIAEADLGALGAAMGENQKHLEALEVSCAEIERMCALALEAGALGAKLTGGGGGGCVIAVAPGREDAVRRSWEQAGFATFVTHVGGESATSATAERRATA